MTRSITSCAFLSFDATGRFRFNHVTEPRYNFTCGTLSVFIPQLLVRRRMSRSRRSNNMSQNENLADGPPVERSETTYQRLYPSLPDTDRYTVCVAAEKLHTAADDPADRSAQSHASAAGSDVRMKAQMLLLEEQKQELLSINTKWAKEYRTMARYYKERVRHLNELLQRGLSEEEMCGEAGNDRKNTEDKLLKEAEELRAQNGRLTRRGERQQDEIRRLNEALEEALKTPQPRSVSSETLQDVWKHQADVYKEDFLKERSDRERLMEKHLKQETKFRKVHSELRVLKSQLTWTRAQQQQPGSGRVSTTHGAAAKTPFAPRQTVTAHDGPRSVPQEVSSKPTLTACDVET